MIVGIFVRHYGIYKNINYIPLSDGDKFTSLIGDNGVGKSSVLDALDKFMNPKDAGEWIINKQARLEGGIKTPDKAPFISVCFLIKHSDSEKLKENHLEALKTLSNYYWTTPKKPQIEEFFKHRELLITENLQNSHYLLIAGKLHEEKDPFFFSFESDIRALIKSKHNSEPHLEKNISDAITNIIDSYTYLYIPAETNVGSFTKLETSKMQILMDKNIQDAVGKTITDKTVNDINSKLDNFISEIEEILPNYTYKAPGKKNKLTKLDIIQKTIESYFSIKVLHKKTNRLEVSVENLSSGEKRRALVDLAFSFLIHGENRDTKIILAIDEPEISLHIDSCFEQFEKLREITEKGHQVIITTHWYGHLPHASSGKSILIKKEDGELKKYSFNLSNYREQINKEKDTTKGRLPYNVQLKSYNDLTQSIIASIQSGYSWIICEGSTEKLYLEHYLKTDLTKLRILPAGGAPEVLKIAKYLQTPLQEKDLAPTGNVFCIVDTDRDKKDFETNQSVKCLHVKRLLRTGDSIELVEIGHKDQSPITEIEDALDASIYIETLKNLAPEQIKSILTEENIRKDATISGYCLDLKDSQKELIENYFSSPGAKFKFAKSYIATATRPAPKWIQSLISIIHSNPTPATPKENQTTQRRSKKTNH